MLTETNNGGQDSLTHQYDATGNIMSRQLGANTLGYTYDPAHKHAVKTVTINGQVKTFVYDANCNMTTGFDFTDPANIASRTIAYNTENLPTQIKYTKSGNTATTTFAYDGNGVRTKKIVQGGATTYYIGEHYEVAGGVPTLYIFAGNQRIAKITATDKHYFHQDHLGSSTTISDASGAGVETAEYLPFGAMREHSGNTVSNYKYTGQELDPESGLYNYKARLYDPVLGRFITADTIVPGFADPQAFNRYAYVKNNPLKYTDPSGHEWFGYEGDPHVFGYNDHRINEPFGANNPTMVGIQTYAPNMKQTALVHDPMVNALKTGIPAIDVPTNVITMPVAFVAAFAYNVLTTPYNVLDTVFGFDETDQANTDNSLGLEGSSYGLGAEGFGNHDSYDPFGLDNFDLNDSSVEGFDYGAAAGDPFGATGTFDNSSNPDDMGADSNNGGKIICVELFRQGLMNPDIYKADEAFGRHLYHTNIAALKGYQLWAKPVVKIMRISKLATNIVYFFAKPWTEEMAYRMGAREKGNSWGNILMIVGIPLCQLLWNITSINNEYFFLLCNSLCMILSFIAILMWSSRTKATQLILCILILVLLPGCDPLSYKDYYFNQGNLNVYQGKYNDAITYFNWAIRDNPQNAQAFFGRGVSWLKKRNDQAAISDFTTAITLKPDYWEAYLNRATTWVLIRDADKALADYNSGVDIALKNSNSSIENDDNLYILKSEIWYLKRDYSQVTSALLKAIELNPTNHRAYNNYAWLLATCPDVIFRDGDKAIVYAQKAINISSRPHYYDTLAAAYAETRNFSQAIKIQKKALQLTNKSDYALLVRCKEHLKLYKRAEPVRSEAAKSVIDQLSTADQ